MLTLPDWTSVDWLNMKKKVQTGCCKHNNAKKTATSDGAKEIILWPREFSTADRSVGTRLCGGPERNRGERVDHIALALHISACQGAELGLVSY